MKNLRILLLLAICVMPCGKAVQAEEARVPASALTVIKPGVGIGKVKIGDKAASVIKKMNKIEEQTGLLSVEGHTVKTKDGRDEFWIDYKDLNITFALEEDKKLGSIMVSNPMSRLSDSGIGPFDSVDLVRKAYGEPEESKELDKNYTEMVYKSKGLSFTIDKSTEKIAVIKIREKM